MSQRMDDGGRRLPPRRLPGRLPGDLEAIRNAWRAAPTFEFDGVRAAELWKCGLVELGPGLPMECEVMPVV